MTREEAIEILKQFKKCLSDVVFDEKGSEAWQMAISALTLKSPCRLCRFINDKSGICDMCPAMPLERGCRQNETDN